jgi:hypothetical protein
LRPQRLPKQLAAARNAVGVGAYCRHQGRSARARFPARHRNPLVGVTVRRPACDLKIDLAVSVTCQFDTRDRIQFDEDARADQGAPPCRAAPRRAGGMPDQCTVRTRPLLYSAAASSASDDQETKIGNRHRNALHLQLCRDLIKALQSRIASAWLRSPSPTSINTRCRLASHVAS